MAEARSAGSAGGWSRGFHDSSSVGKAFGERRADCSSLSTFKYGAFLQLSPRFSKILVPDGAPGC